MILSTGYSDFLVLELRDSLVEGGSHIFQGVRFPSIVFHVGLLWCGGDKAGGHCVMDVIFLMCDRIQSGRDYPERSDAFLYQLLARLVRKTNSTR